MSFCKARPRSTLPCDVMNQFYFPSFVILGYILVIWLSCITVIPAGTRPISEQCVCLFILCEVTPYGKFRDKAFTPTLRVTGHASQSKIPLQWQVFPVLEMQPPTGILQIYLTPKVSVPQGTRKLKGSGTHRHFELARVRRGCPCHKTAGSASPAEQTREPAVRIKV